MPRNYSKAAAQEIEDKFAVRTSKLKERDEKGKSAYHQGFVAGYSQCLEQFRDVSTALIVQINISNAYLRALKENGYENANNE